VGVLRVPLPNLSRTSTVVRSGAAELHQRALSGYLRRRPQHVVGYAGLLDLGFVAFWAIGGYTAGG
jgi:hypothetical protein